MSNIVRRFIDGPPDDGPPRWLVQAEQAGLVEVTRHDIQVAVRQRKAKREVQAKSDVAGYGLERLMREYDEGLSQADGSAYKQRLLQRGMSELEDSVWGAFHRHLG